MTSCFAMPDSRWTKIVETPKETLAGLIVDQFKDGDIPPEIPYFLFEGVLAGHLLASGTRIVGPSGPVMPDAWIAILGESGIGKTPAVEILERMLGLQIKLQEIAVNFEASVSAAAMFEDMHRHAKSFSLIEYLHSFYYFLYHGYDWRRRQEMIFRIVSHEDLSRTTMREGTRFVKKPALAVVGMGIPSLFAKECAADRGAFGSLFLCVRARFPRDMKWGDQFQGFEPGSLNGEWTKLVSSAAGREYTPSAEGLAVHEDAKRSRTNLLEAS